jgi:acyl-CoA thioester hydrolase
MSAESTSPVRFSDVDAYGVVWHGNYIHYMEDARAAFGQVYGEDFTFQDRQNYLAPVVHCSVDHRTPLRSTETALVRAYFLVPKSTKIEFLYVVFRSSDLTPVATAYTIQILTDGSGNPMLTGCELLDDFCRTHGIEQAHP